MIFKNGLDKEINKKCQSLDNYWSEILKIRTKLDPRTGQIQVVDLQCSLSAARVAEFTQLIQFH